MVPTGKHVREVYLGDNSVMTALNSLSQEERAATLCLDQSTIEQSVSKDVALAMRAVGADMLDAPVSGGMTSRGVSSLQVPHIHVLTRLQGLLARRMVRWPSCAVAAMPPSRKRLRFCRLWPVKSLTAVILVPDLLRRSRISKVSRARSSA